MPKGRKKFCVSGVPRSLCLHDPWRLLKGPTSTAVTCGSPRGPPKITCKRAQFDASRFASSAPNLHAIQGTLRSLLVTITDIGYEFANGVLVPVDEGWRDFTSVGRMGAASVGRPNTKANRRHSSSDLHPICSTGHRHYTRSSGRACQSGIDIYRRIYGPLPKQPQSQPCLTSRVSGILSLCKAQSNLENQTTDSSCGACTGYHHPRSCNAGTRADA